MLQKITGGILSSLIHTYNLNFIFCLCLHLSFPNLAIYNYDTFDTIIRSIRCNITTIKHWTTKIDLDTSAPARSTRYGQRDNHQRKKNAKQKTGITLGFISKWSILGDFHNLLKPGKLTRIKGQHIRISIMLTSPYNLQRSPHIISTEWKK